MMLNDRDIEAPGPPLVSILRPGSYLIASIHTALNDSELMRFQRDLIDQVGRHRARGVIIDVAAVDVLDSFASLTLRTIVRTAALRGATIVIVGINPEVAFAMVQLGMRMESVHTAMDLDEGLLQLDALTAPAYARRGTDRTSSAPRSGLTLFQDRLRRVHLRTGWAQTSSPVTESANPPGSAALVRS